jgi:hypothetical protein
MALMPYITTEVVHTIRCDHDGCEREGKVFGGTRMQASRDFKVKGWIETEEDILCPVHSVGIRGLK